MENNFFQNPPRNGGNRDVNRPDPFVIFDHEAIELNEAATLFKKHLKMIKSFMQDCVDTHDSRHGYTYAHNPDGTVTRIEPRGEDTPYFLPGIMNIINEFERMDSATLNDNAPILLNRFNEQINHYITENEVRFSFLQPSRLTRQIHADLVRLADGEGTIQDLFPILDERFEEFNAMIADPHEPIPEHVQAQANYWRYKLTPQSYEFERYTKASYAEAIDDTIDVLTNAYNIMPHPRPTLK